MCNVVSCFPRYKQKVGVKKFFSRAYPHLQNRGAALAASWDTASVPRYKFTPPRKNIITVVQSHAVRIVRVAIDVTSRHVQQVV